MTIDSGIHRRTREPLAFAPPDFERRVYCLLGLPVDAVTKQETLDRLREAITRRSRRVWTTPNVNHLVACQTDRSFRDTMLHSDLLTADGMPLVLIARMLGVPLRERVAGSNVFELLMQGAAGPARVYFFGGERGVAARASARLSEISRHMRCVGYCAPGFGSVESMCTDDAIEAINEAAPDILVLSLGTARSHAWIKLAGSRLDVPIVSYLGSVINFVAGTIRRAPAWMQRAGLEWLWRIKEEPHLARRYGQECAVLLRLFFTRALPAAAHRLLAAPSAAAFSNARISIAREGGALRLRLAGAWGERNLQPLREALAQAVAERANIVIDLERLSHIDPAVMGLIMIARGHQSRYGRRLDLVSASARIRRLFRLHCAEYLLEGAARPRSPQILAHCRE